MFEPASRRRKPTDGRRDAHSQENEILRVAGSGKARVESARASQVAIDVGGSGSVRLEDMQADEATISVLGSGDVTIAGQVKTLRLRANGSGRFDAHALLAESCRVASHGSAHLRLFASRQIDAEVYGSSDLHIEGRPAERQVVVRGSGSIRWD